MTKANLKEIIETKGFLSTFKKMVEFSQKTGNEAKVEAGSCTTLPEIIYALSHGGPNDVDAFPLGYFNKEGEEIGKPELDYTERFSTHTHPQYNREYPLRWFRFSKGDLLSLVHRENIKIGGVTIFPSKNVAKTLIWKPSFKYEEEELEQLAHDLERAIIDDDVEESVVNILTPYGSTSVLNMEKKNGIWRPNKEDSEKLEKYTIDLD